MAFTKVVGPGIHTLAQLRTHNIHSAGIITATKFVGEMESGGGDSTFQNVTVNGNLTVQGDTTTLNTTLRNVELLRVAANSATTAGIITQTGAGDILNLFDGTTEVLTVTDGGKVGIGLTNPSSTSILHLRTSANHNLEFEESGGNLRISALNDARDTNEVLQLAASEFNLLTGNVGINDNSPDTRLSVNSGTTDVVAKFTSSDAKAWIQFRDNSTTDTGVMIGAEGDDMLLRAGSNERVRIKANGTILPASDNSQNIGTGITNFASIWASTRFRGNDNVKLVLGNSQNLVIRHDGTNNIIGSPVADDLHIKSGTLDNDNQLIAAFVHSNTSVGIGLTNPGEKLQVDGSMQVSGGYKVAGHPVVTYSSFNLGGGTYATRLGSTGTSTLRHTQIYGGGSHLATFDGVNTRLGIGVTNPTVDLEIVGSVGTGATIFLNAPTHNTNVASNAMIKLGYKHSGGQAVGYFKLTEGGGNSFDGNITIGVPYNQGSGNFGTRDAVTIKYSGRVGVGTDNPDAPLEIYNHTTSGNTVLKIHNDKTGDAAQICLEGGRTSTNDFGQVLFKNRGNVNAIIQAMGSADDGALLFKTSAIGSGNGLSSYLQIAANGNIKLGQNSQNAPGAQFHVEDNNNTDYNPDATTSAASEYFVNSGTGDCTGIILQNTSTDATNTCQATIHSVAEGTTKDTALTFGTRQNSDQTIRERLRIKSDGNIEAAGNLKTNNIPGKNLLINGNFHVWQRGTSTTTAGFGAADRWYHNLSGANMTFSRQTHTNPIDGSPYYARIASTTSDDNCGLGYFVEDVRTLPEGKVTISFWARGHVNGNLGVWGTLYYGSGGSSDVDLAVQRTPYLQNDTTFRKYSLTFTIPSHSGKTFGADSAFRLYLGQGPGDSASAWTLDISNIQLEVGSIATAFEQRSFAEELRLCQRYYQKIDGASDLTPFGYGRANGTAQAEVGIPLTVPLRKSPDLTCANNSAWGPSSSSTSSSAPTVQRWTKYATVLAVSFPGHSGLTNGRVTSVHCASSSNFEMDAEL